MRIRRGRHWGFTDTLVGYGMYGLVMVYSMSYDGHSGGAYIAYNYTHSSMVCV